MSSKDDLRNFQLQLDQVNDGLSIAPDDQELLDLKSELTDLISLLKEQLAAEEAEQQAKDRKWLERNAAKAQVPVKLAQPVSPSIPDGQATPPPPPPPPDEKPDQKPDHIIFKVGDVVSAKWTAGDGGYYAAKVTQVTGSSHLPHYTVQFVQSKDKSVTTLPAYSVKPLAEEKKRKFTEGFQKPPPPKKVDPQAREAAEEKKRRRQHERAEAERTKQKWQDFRQKGPKKRVGAVGKPVPIGSTSMFQTPDNHLGRVGVINSGKGVTEHLGRVKHKFEKVKTLDED